MLEIGTKLHRGKEKEIRPYVKNVSNRRKKRKRQGITYERRIFAYFPLMMIILCCLRLTVNVRERTDLLS